MNLPQGDVSMRIEMKNIDIKRSNIMKTVGVGNYVISSRS